MPTQLTRLVPVCSRCNNTYKPRALAELLNARRQLLQHSRKPTDKANADPGTSPELARDFLDIFNRKGISDREVYQILDPTIKGKGDGLIALTEWLEDLASTSPPASVTQEEQSSLHGSSIRGRARSLAEDVVASTVLPPPSRPACKCRAAYTEASAPLSCLDLALLTDAVPAIKFLFRLGLSPFTVLPTSFNILGTAILASATAIVTHIYESYTIPVEANVGDEDTTTPPPGQKRLHPLLLALSVNNIAMFSLIRRYTPKQEVPPTVLLWAAEHAEVRTVRALREEAGVVVLGKSDEDRMVTAVFSEEDVADLEAGWIETTEPIHTSIIMLHHAAANLATDDGMLRYLIGLLPADRRVYDGFLNARCWYGITPLMEAVCVGNYAGAAYLCTFPDLDLDAVNARHMSALYVATRHFDVRAMEILFDAGCGNGNARADNDGRPVKPPLYAIIEGHRRARVHRFDPAELERHIARVMDTARLLLLKKADPRIQWGELTLLEEVKAEPALEKLARMLEHEVLGQKNFALSPV
ncbi:uncharacterized protein BO97DRAFT_461827 [Aspergillus homomorphus CBS 101889]|uniref:Uncharacterized protein n=1 Tax=Aspergillus homomorphus (strain CBS 101889) TaxID=1450537 RepID=A0A395HN72_ASPHC|nr:hypothetical protein BO97DRAFT_461827 [Aspergillus homomorphus CBS 101889]RAL08288.1 hypothetical protein BO97DRAFT_461827 [Aspergillus homomorphus CBS 101889]